MTVKNDIANLVREALARAQAAKKLPPGPVEEVTVDRPQKAEHGDFACSLPLKMARSLRMNPMEIAQRLASAIPAEGPLQRVWAAPPGFINFSLRDSWLAAQVDTIRGARGRYGDVGVGEGQRVQVEYVSVNPTGPLHVAHARGAVIGSALANILSAAGYDVQQEYYVNDAGNQIEQFGRSLYARYRQVTGGEAELPPDGYVGEYMVELARELEAAEGDRFLGMDEEDAVTELGEIGVGRMLDAIRSDLELLGVRFDEWFSERSLYSGGQYERAIGLLDEGDFLAKRDGAVWFTSGALGEDKDAVLVRRSGAPTYFASDVAYHYNKFVERGFDLVIDVWGADHQGHVARMKAVVDALGAPPDGLTLLITQMVTLKRGDEVVRLSKRSGDIVSLRELVEEVRGDACRFFFLSRSAESQMEFDLELAKEESSENPVYYIQYAHARIASILRLARERGIDYADGDVSMLTHEAELGLIRKMLVLPELVETMARSLEPHHLPHYAVEVATAFHWFYQQCRVVSSAPEDAAMTRARLKLAEAARIVLARCLGLMIMSAPEEM